MACQAIQFMNDHRFTPFSIQVRRYAVFIRQTIFLPNIEVFVHVQLCKTSVHNWRDLPLALLAMKKLIADVEKQKIYREMDEARVPPITVTPKPPSKHSRHSHSHDKDPKEADRAIEEAPRGKAPDTTYMSNYELTTFPEWVCIPVHPSIRFVAHVQSVEWA